VVPNGDTRTAHAPGAPPAQRCQPHHTLSCAATRAARSSSARATNTEKSCARGGAASALRRAGRRGRLVQCAGGVATLAEAGPLLLGAARVAESCARSRRLQQSWAGAWYTLACCRRQQNSLASKAGGGDQVSARPRCYTGLDQGLRRPRALRSGQDTVTVLSNHRYGSRRQRGTPGTLA